MAKQSINQLKQWFRTGLFPTQSQFWDLIDSFFQKDDKIPIDSVDGLTQLLQDMNEAIGTGGGNTGPTVLTGAASWDVPARYLIDKIVIEETAAITANIGTASGLADLANEGVQGVDNTIQFRLL